MTKSDMRDLLDHLIEAENEAIKRHQIQLEFLEELRAEMHNRPRAMQGKPTSRKVTKTIKQAVLTIRKAQPDLPQHEIARRLKITPARVSEIVAGKRT